MGFKKRPKKIKKKYACGHDPLKDTFMAPCKVCGGRTDWADFFAHDF